MEKYGIAIIGGGPAGYVGAIRASQLDINVCLIESGELGGACTNVGCIPTKAILASVRFLSYWRSAGDLGIDIHGVPSANLKQIRERKEKIVRIQRHGIENLLKSNKVTLIRGKGKLVDPHTIAVIGETDMVGAHRIVLATGSRPKSLPHIPFDGDMVLSSDHAVELKNIPEKLLIVGGGTIGAEFAFIYAGLGSKVTVVEMMDRVLPLEDEDVSAIIAREMRTSGIDVMTGIKVESLFRKKKGASVILDDGTELTVSKILVSVGRTSNTEALDLSAVGVRLRDDNSIDTNEKLETNVPNIYAAGDCIGGRLLAHVASREAIVAVENCLGTPLGVDYNVIPGCTFTIPEVASVGLTEAAARASGKEIKTGRFDFRGLGKAHADGEIVGMVKIVADSETDKILGAHIVGNEASCLIHELAVVMKGGMTASDLGETVHAHPTFSEAIMEAAADVQDASIHKPKISKSQ